jgi:hypothetical protein
LNSRLVGVTAGVGIFSTDNCTGARHRKYRPGRPRWRLPVPPDIRSAPESGSCPPTGSHQASLAHHRPPMRLSRRSAGEQAAPSRPREWEASLPADIAGRKSLSVPWTILGWCGLTQDDADSRRRMVFGTEDAARALSGSQGRTTRPKPRHPQEQERQTGRRPQQAPPAG